MRGISFLCFCVFLFNQFFKAAQYIVHFILSVLNFWNRIFVS
jgi:hypothetical protein